MARDAMTAWISGAIEDGEEVPVPDMERTPARFLSASLARSTKSCPARQSVKA